MEISQVLPEHAWTGSRMINVRNPDPRDIVLSEVAVGLSRETRYGGAATLIPWSVAQHCLLVDEMAVSDGVTSAEIRATLLLHDAPEYMLRDMIAPVKRELPDYQALEDRWWGAVAVSFGLPSELPGIVKFYDRLAAASERAALISPEAGEWPGFEGVRPRAIPAHLLCMSATEVAAEFLSRAEGCLAAMPGGVQ